jgi:anti-anti-sigma factor
MLKVSAEKFGGTAILRFEGRIAVGGGTEILRNAVISQVDVNAVILDLARVSGIDAGGLGAMLELREVIQSKGVAFRLMNVTKLVGQLLRLTCLDSVFEISTEVEVLSVASAGRPAAAVGTPACLFN